MKPIIYLTLSILLGFQFQFLHAQKTPAKTDMFQQRKFGKYFISDYYAPLVNLSAGLALNHDEYNIDPSRDGKYIFLAEPVLGTEIPLLVRKNEQTAFAVSFPISFAVFFDLLEDRTAPILNTDYRVGVFEMNYMHKIDKGFVKNVGFKFIPIFHESTHIGDELTIRRRQDSFPTARINPSYETFELAFMLNDANNKAERNHSFKLGSRFLFKPREKGWYTVSPLEADSASILPSKRGIEPYLQYQFQDPVGILAGKSAAFVFSVDARLRVRFGYPYYQWDPNGQLEEFPVEEAYQASFNVLAGWRFTNKTELRRFGIYLRAYTGINPHGQFRNIPEYQFMGISLVYQN